MIEKLIEFKHIIRTCNYENTYKVAFAKSLVELASEMDLNQTTVEIPLEFIAKKYIKYYWNQTIFFDLIQGSNPLKPPKVLTTTKKLINLYYSISDNNNPILYEKIEYLFLDEPFNKEYTQAIKEVVRALKENVSYRFLNIDNTISNVYSYKKGDNSLFIQSDLLKEFITHEVDLYDLINYRWGLILETFNNSPRINKKVKIMDEREIPRKSLDKFKKYLDLENQEHVCFLCGKHTLLDELAIDHVIPWSFLYSDDIWNLVYVCQSCNSKKSNKVPDENLINKLKDRNYRLLQLLETNRHDKQYNDLSLANQRDYVHKFWIACKN